jgi:hypothetical protein
MTRPTLTELRQEAGPKHDVWILRAWAASRDHTVSEARGRASTMLVGCGDHGCFVVPPDGHGTNIGCRCDVLALRRAIVTLRAHLVDGGMP